ncbi:MAG: NYN domain-containing protein [Methylovirgula sp.]
MTRVAIFVDAGYLYAQGGVALFGSKKPRHDLILDSPAAIAELKLAAAAKAASCSLLRIYWYDGARTPDLSPEQARLASLDDVKIRLGSLNSAGDQKGVDSLIVTDLIELARQKAICDAVVLSGDEDIRIGVQIAQNYGVRIHLLGISPSRGSQSMQLIREADTTQEWSSEIVRRFLSLRAAAVAVTTVAVTAIQVSSTKRYDVADFDPALELATKEFVDSLDGVEIEQLQAYWKSGRGVPPDFDRQLLPLGGKALGRDLTSSEKTFVRARFKKLITDRIARGS